MIDFKQLLKEAIFDYQGVAIISILHEWVQLSSQNVVVSQTLTSIPNITFFEPHRFLLMETCL